MKLAMKSKVLLAGREKSVLAWESGVSFSLGEERVYRFGNIK